MKCSKILYLEDDFTPGALFMKCSKLVLTVRTVTKTSSNF